MTLNLFSQIDYAGFKDGKEQDDGKQKKLKKKQKILKKKQKNKHKHTKGSKKGKKQRDAQEDLNRMESLMKVLEMLVTQSTPNNIALAC